MDNILFNKKYLKVTKQINKNTFIVIYKDKECLLMLFDEEEYTNFLKDYKELKISGIPMGKLLKKDKKDFKVLLSYIEAENTVLDLLVNEPINELLLKEIFKISWYARHTNINIDYRPDNFALIKDTLYYLPYKVSRGYEKARSFELEGIRYWFYTKEFYNYCVSKGLNFDKEKIKDEYKTNKEIVLAVCRYQR